MDDLETLPNLGPASAGWLRAAGIRSRADLEAAGAAGAFLLVREAGFRPSLNLLWALAAGLEGRHWASLSDVEKRRLRAELDDAGP